MEYIAGRDAGALRVLLLQERNARRWRRRRRKVPVRTASHQRLCKLCKRVNAAWLWLVLFVWGGCWTAPTNHLTNYLLPAHCVQAPPHSLWIPSGFLSGLGMLSTHHAGPAPRKPPSHRTAEAAVPVRPSSLDTLSARNKPVMLREMTAADCLVYPPLSSMSRGTLMRAAVRQTVASRCSMPAAETRSLCVQGDEWEQAAAASARVSSCPGNRQMQS